MLHLTIMYVLKFMHMPFFDAILVKYNTVFANSVESLDTQSVSYHQSLSALHNNVSPVCYGSQVKHSKSKSSK